VEGKSPGEERLVVDGLEGLCWKLGVGAWTELTELSEGNGRDATLGRAVADGRPGGVVRELGNREWARICQTCRR